MLAFVSSPLIKRRYVDHGRVNADLCQA